MDDMAVDGKNSFYCSLTLNNIRASEIVATDALKFTFSHPLLALREYKNNVRCRHLMSELPRHRTLLITIGLTLCGKEAKQHTGCNS